MKVCFLGCGVIGSLYAALFAKARISVELYARGERKKVLEDRGLEIEIGGRVVQFNLPLVADLKHNYDFLFVAVKNEQIEDALQELKESPCRNIVTMVNTAEGYEKWEEIVGKGRLIPAFPGAGGEIQGGVVKASLTPMGKKHADWNVWKSCLKKLKFPMNYVALWEIGNYAIWL